MRWLLGNPDKSLTECAAALGYTLPWVSVVVRSHAFQAELKDRQEQLYGDVALDIKDKLTGAAHMALDRIIDNLPVATPDHALDVAKETLKALGYSSPRAPQPGNVTNITHIQQNNIGNVSPEELARARAIMLSRSAPGGGPAVPIDPVPMEALNAPDPASAIEALPATATQ